MTGAAMTGAQAAYNHHHIKKQLDENITTAKAYHQIYSADKYKNSNVSISTFNDAVLITGQIPSPLHKLEIAHLVKNVSGERKVYDYTEIVNPCSYITRASDSWITTKIKTQFIASNEIDPSLIKVITENGTVYLMGTVHPDQADVAVQIAQDTAGVQNVVKLFSYLHITSA